MAQFSRILGSLAAIFLSTPLVSAQTPPVVPLPGGMPPVPSPAGTPGSPGLDPFLRRYVASDCVLQGMVLKVQARRNVTLFDLGMRVRGLRGGACTIRPEALQLNSAKGSSSLLRPLAITYVDGQLQRPISLADTPEASARLTPWTANLAAGEEKTVTFRWVSEGDVFSNGDADPARYFRLNLQMLGTKVATGAPFDLRLALEPPAVGRVLLTTGRRRGPPVPQVTGPQGTLQMSQPLSKDDTAPSVEWFYEGEPPPAASPASLASGGLSVFEYLRGGLARDLTAGISDPPDAKRAAAAWDTALVTALAAAQSSDPLVAGLGVRSLAWITSGFAPTPAELRGMSDTSQPGTPVPDEIAAEVRRALPAFGEFAGKPVPPFPVNSQTLTLLKPKLGDTALRAREARIALDRVAKRNDAWKTSANVGEILKGFGAPASPTLLAPRGARVVDFTSRGANYLTRGSAAAPREPYGRKLVRMVTHPRPRPWLILVALLFASAGLFYVYARQFKQAAYRLKKEERRRNKPTFGLSTIA